MRVAPDPRAVTLLALALVAAAGLGGCGRRTVERTPEALEHVRLEKADPDHGRPVGPLLSEIGAQAGTAEVVAVDPGQLTIALRHTQVDAADWPTLVMTFRARRSLVDQARVGQRVRVRLVLRDGVGEIVDLAPVGRAAGPDPAAKPAP